MEVELVFMYIVGVGMIMHLGCDNRCVDFVSNRMFPHSDKKYQHTDCIFNIYDAIPCNEIFCFANSNRTS